MTAVFSVVEPGLLTTIQDLGRPGAIASGVPPGGAMDRFAHAAANLLAGNDRNQPTLECTLSGPQLVALRSCLVAVTGADLGAQVNGRMAPIWSGIFLAAGDRLSFAGRRSGMRAYVAVSGGFDGERWLGSRSTYLLVGRGGMQGRALKAGDELHLAADRSAPMVAGRQLAAAMVPDYSDHTLAVMAGPHLKRLNVTSRKALFADTFKVSGQADRMGYRLNGPPLALSGDELLSFGLAAGSIQVVNSVVVLVGIRRYRRQEGQASGIVEGRWIGPIEVLGGLLSEHSHQVSVGILEVTPGLIDGIIAVPLPHLVVDVVHLIDFAGSTHCQELVASLEQRQQPVLPRADVHEMVFDRPAAVGSWRRQPGGVDGGDQVDQLLPLRVDASANLVGGHAAAATFLASAITWS